MKQYLELAKFVLENGEEHKDRTGTGTISYFGRQSRYDLKHSFPLLTTKKVHWKSVVHELIWFIQGDTNIRYLVQNGVRIWNEWPFEKFKKSPHYKGEDLAQFASMIAADERFAKEFGNLGPVYGAQWRNFGGFDQLKWLVNEIKTNKHSRRLILSAWNPPEIHKMALPPCHAFIQFYVNDKDELSCQLYQRSADIFLGVPFNIASYSLLTLMMAQVTGLKPGTFVHTLGDAHIYKDHIEQIKEQLSREPKPLPTIKLNPNIKNIEDFKFEDIELCNYDSWPLIKGKVSV